MTVLHRFYFKETALYLKIPLFTGNIQQLKLEHDKNLAEYNKAQELNKARMEQGLQEKLNARRKKLYWIVLHLIIMSQRIEN